MQETPTLFPRDAVLLGLALGEFLELHKLGESDTFEEVLYRRVHPFVPDMSREIWREIPDKELPKGLIWKSVGNNEERSVPDLSLNDDPLVQSNVDPFAVAQQHQFGRRGEQLYRIEIDESEKTMLDSLVGYLTGGNRTKWNDPESVVTRWDQLLGIPVENKTRLEQIPHDEISRLLNRLIEDNEMSQVFASGRLLGRAFANCVATEKELIEMEDSFLGIREESSDDFQEELEFPPITEEHEASIEPIASENFWDEFLTALHKDPLYLACFFAPDWLRSGKEFWSGRYFGLTRGIDPSGSALNQEFCMRTSLSLILGGILGFLTDKQRQADTKEAQKHVPRKLSISKTAARGQIEGVLFWAEQAIKGESTQNASEVPLSMMVNLIEKLTVELWRPKPQQSVKELLHESKRGSPSKLEQEFIDKAIFHYDAYRKRTEHPGGVFRCGVYEAPAFYYAMRDLDDLAKRILEQRKKGKS